MSGYRRDALLTPLFWNWLLGAAQCCGVGEEGWTVWKTAQLKVKKIEREEDRRSQLCMEGGFQLKVR